MAPEACCFLQTFAGILVINVYGAPLIHKQSSFICYILFWRFLTEILIAR
jgi:hypothetical protein